VKKAIMSNCVVPGPNGDMFAWSVDLEGNFELHDEPSGSLQLLSWLEFCPQDLPAFKNTVDWIRTRNNSIKNGKGSTALSDRSEYGCSSILAVANDLISGYVEEATDFLRSVSMDDFIACESVDSVTGTAASGLAFAAAAGYLVSALVIATGAKTESAPVAGRDVYIAERLSPTPPEIRDSID
jgi:hypothetical protein